MKKAKKIIALILGCMMLIGATLTIQAKSFDYLPADGHCLNSSCGNARLQQEKYCTYWYCPDPACGWTYYEF